MSYTLTQLGWPETYTSQFEHLLHQGFSFARVSNEQRGHYYILSPEGAFRAEPSGKILYATEFPSDLPKVGDWVAYMAHTESEAIIYEVLPRYSKLSRKESGGDDEQILAVNVDILFVMQGLDRDFNLRRLERYIALARSSGVTPIVLLNKADLTDAPDHYIDEIRKLDDTITVLSLSALHGQSVEQVLACIPSGTAAAIAGSSGAGKSTLLNRLLGEDVQHTAAVRSQDARGRHTTTSRSLHVIPNGGLMIDTPGMRELGLWADADDIETTFMDIEALAEQCRYRDCTHSVEAGCAVLAAVENGEMDANRLKNFHKMMQELDYLNDSASYRARKEQRFKQIQKEYKAFLKKRKV